IHQEDARAARAVGANAEEIKNAFGEPRNRRRRRKKLSGSVLPNFLETAARKRKRRHNRAMARSQHRDLRASQNGLKSRPRVSTLATCPSTRPRAISSSCSTALATCKTQRS